VKSYLLRCSAVCVQRGLSGNLDDFHTVTLHDWFDHTWVPLHWTLYVILLTEAPPGCFGDFIMSLPPCIPVVLVEYTLTCCVHEQFHVCLWTRHYFLCSVLHVLYSGLEATFQLAALHKLTNYVALRWRNRHITCLLTRFIFHSWIAAGETSTYHHGRDCRSCL